MIKFIDELKSEYMTEVTKVSGKTSIELNLSGFNILSEYKTQQVIKLIFPFIFVFIHKNTGIILEQMRTLVQSL